MARRAATTKNLIRRISGHTQNSMIKAARRRIAQHFIGDYPHGMETMITILRKLITLRDKYQREPELHETTMQDHDTWANMTLRNTKDEPEKSTTREHPCAHMNAERAGNYSPRKRDKEAQKAQRTIPTNRKALCHGQQVAPA